MKRTWYWKRTVAIAATTAAVLTNKTTTIRIAHAQEFPVIAAVNQHAALQVDVQVRYIAVPDDRQEHHLPWKNTKTHSGSLIKTMPTDIAAPPHVVTVTVHELVEHGHAPILLQQRRLATHLDEMRLLARANTTFVFELLERTAVADDFERVLLLELIISHSTRRSDIVAARRLVKLPRRVGGSTWHRDRNEHQQRRPPYVQRVELHGTLPLPGARNLLGDAAPPPPPGLGSGAVVAVLTALLLLLMVATAGARNVFVTMHARNNDDALVRQLGHNLHHELEHCDELVGANEEDAVRENATDDAMEVVIHRDVDDDESGKSVGERTWEECLASDLDDNPDGGDASDAESEALGRNNSPTFHLRAASPSSSSSSSNSSGPARPPRMQRWAPRLDHATATTMHVTAVAASNGRDMGASSSFADELERLSRLHQSPRPTLPRTVHVGRTPAAAAAAAKRTGTNSTEDNWQLTPYYLRRDVAMDGPIAASPRLQFPLFAGPNCAAAAAKVAPRQGMDPMLRSGSASTPHTFTTPVSILHAQEKAHPRSADTTPGRFSPALVAAAALGLASKVSQTANNSRADMPVVTAMPWTSPIGQLKRDIQGDMDISNGSVDPVMRAGPPAMGVATAGSSVTSPPEEAPNVRVVTCSAKQPPPALLDAMDLDDKDNAENEERERAFTPGGVRSDLSQRLESATTTATMRGPIKTDDEERQDGKWTELNAMVPPNGVHLGDDLFRHNASDEDGRCNGAVTTTAVYDGSLSVDMRRHDGVLVAQDDIRYSAGVPPPASAAIGLEQYQNSDSTGVKNLEEEDCFTNNHGVAANASSSPKIWTGGSLPIESRLVQSDSDPALHCDAHYSIEACPPGCNNTIFVRRMEQLSGTLHEDRDTKPSAKVDAVRNDLKLDGFADTDRTPELLSRQDIGAGVFSRLPPLEAATRAVRADNTAALDDELADDRDAATCQAREPVDEPHVPHHTLCDGGNRQQNARTSPTRIGPKTETTLEKLLLSVDSTYCSTLPPSSDYGSDDDRTDVKPAAFCLSPQRLVVRDSFSEQQTPARNLQLMLFTMAGGLNIRQTGSQSCTTPTAAEKAEAPLLSRASMPHSCIGTTMEKAVDAHTQVGCVAGCHKLPSAGWDSTNAIATAVCEEYTATQGKAALSWNSLESPKRSMSAQHLESPGFPMCDEDVAGLDPPGEDEFQGDIVRCCPSKSTKNPTEDVAMASSAKAALRNDASRDSNGVPSPRRKMRRRSMSRFVKSESSDDKEFDFAATPDEPSLAAGAAQNAAGSDDDDESILLLFTKRVDLSAVLPDAPVSNSLLSAATHLEAPSWNFGTNNVPKAAAEKEMKPKRKRIKATAAKRSDRNVPPVIHVSADAKLPPKAVTNQSANHGTERAPASTITTASRTVSESTKNSELGQAAAFKPLTGKSLPESAATGTADRKRPLDYRGPARPARSARPAKRVRRRQNEPTFDVDDDDDPDSVFALPDETSRKKRRRDKTSNAMLA